MKGFGRALLAGGVLLLLLALVLAAFGLPVFSSMLTMAEGAFGDRFGLARTFVKATPLAFCSLGIVVAWRAGMFNIGGEGQFVLGGIGGAAAAKLTAGLAGPMLVLVGILASVGGGLAFGLLAGWLAVRRGVNVVIGTILLNFVAIQLLGWAVSGPLQESKGQVPLSDRLPDSAMLFRFDRQSDFHVGVVIALLTGVAVSVFLFRTIAGFRLRLVGENPSAARAARIPPEPIQLRAMALSGALCGLGGGVELFGLSAQLGTGFALGWGFLAIPTALVGGLTPIGALLSSLFFGAVLAGAESLARFSSGGGAIVLVLQAVAVIGWMGWRSLSSRDRVSEAGT